MHEDTIKIQTNPMLNRFDGYGFGLAYYLNETVGRVVRENVVWLGRKYEGLR